MYRMNEIFTLTWIFFFYAKLLRILFLYRFNDLQKLLILVPPTAKTLQDSSFNDLTGIKIYRLSDIISI